MTKAVLFVTILLVGLLTGSTHAQQMRELELFVVMDGEFTQRIAPVTPQEWIDNLIAESNVWWERDLGIRIKLVRLDAFTDPATDPFGQFPTSDVQGLLNEIVAYGHTVSTPRDATHLFTGRAMQYGGYTYVGVTCEWPAFSYGWSQLGFWGYTWTIDVASVELSHQLGGHYYDTITSCDGALLGKGPQPEDYHQNWFCAAARADIDAHLAASPACVVPPGDPPPVGDTQAPTVAITVPATNRIPAGATFEIAAQASDNVGVVRVEFSVNGGLVCSDTEAPYTCTAPQSKRKNYRIDVRAVDAAGNAGIASKTVSAR
jgi:hypothetical protein